MIALIFEPLKSGWVAMGENGHWYWQKDKPKLRKIDIPTLRKPIEFWISKGDFFLLSDCFKISKFNGSWRDSLIKVEHKEKE